MSRACVIRSPGEPIHVGTGRPLAIIAGPCVLEGFDLSCRVAETVGGACAELGLAFVFKASFDKANRTSLASERGPGIDEGLDHLRRVRERFGVPVTTDVHDPDQATRAGEIVDVLQIPHASRARPTSCSPPDAPRARAGASSTSRRASSCRRTRWSAQSRRSARPGAIA